MATDSVKITIVIPVLNEAGQIRQSIRRAWDSGADQVTVVDGGSTDETCSIAASEDCQLVNSSPGRAVQMNRGASESDSDVLVFLHADNYLATDSCNQIRHALELGQGDFGAFRQRIESRDRIFRWIESGNAIRVNWQGLIYGDQAFFIRRKMFEQVGGFPVIELMEDFALSRQLRRLGRPLLLSGPTIVNPRRWKKTGPIRQTIRNWFLSVAFRLGASPAWLAARYRRHDQ